jgi:hypothetical protein
MSQLQEFADEIVKNLRKEIERLSRRGFYDTSATDVERAKIEALEEVCSAIEGAAASIGSGE